MNKPKPYRSSFTAQEPIISGASDMLRIFEDGSKTPAANDTRNKITGS